MDGSYKGNKKLYYHQRMQQSAHSVMREAQGAASSGGVHCGLPGVCGNCVFLGQIQTTDGTCYLCEHRNYNHKM
jgi:hypothetical protein